MEVKPCPFCGTKVDLENPDTIYPSGSFYRYEPELECDVYVSRRDKKEGDQEMWKMGCVSVSCGVELYAHSYEEAIEKWNRRTP